MGLSFYGAFKFIIQSTAKKEGLEKGREEGREQGREEGREEEARLFSRLMQVLLTSGDTQQMQNVLTNPDLRKSLYKKYNIQ